MGIAVALAGEVGHADPGTVYVEFDGVTLTQGPVDDSTANVTAIAELATTLEPFGGDPAERASVLQSVRADFAPFDVRVVDERPSTGDYVMVVVTPTNPFGDGVTGVAVDDCGDAAGQRDVVFAFFRSGQAPANDVGTTIAQEVAHSIGLEHVDDAADVMYPIAAGFDPYFNDDCLALSSASGCPAQHEVFCEQPDHQNAFAELMARFGPADDDGEPPTVILSGPDDDSVRAGTDVDLLVEAFDDTFVDRVQLLEGNTIVGEDRAPPYLFTVTDIEPGQYEIVAVAVDAAGNEASSEPLMLEATGSGSTGLPPTGGPAGIPVSRGTADSGCSVAGSPRAAWTWLLLVLLGLRGRESRRCRAR